MLSSGFKLSRLPNKLKIKLKFNIETRAGFTGCHDNITYLFDWHVWRHRKLEVDQWNSSLFIVVENIIIIKNGEFCFLKNNIFHFCDIYFAFADKSIGIHSVAHLPSNTSKTG